MKKVITLLFAIAIMMPTWAFSEDKEKTELSPPEEMSKVIQCVAIDTSLSHLYLQIAASMVALSAPQSPTLKPLAKSYISLAQDVQNKTKTLSNAAEEVFIPQLVAHGQSKEDIADVSSKLLAKALADINQNLSNPTANIDTKIAMQRALMAASNECDSHFNKIIDNHTF